MEIAEYDWKLYRVEMTQCQKKYMARLCREYIELLSSEKLGAKRFYAMFQRSNKDL